MFRYRHIILHKQYLILQKYNKYNDIISILYCKKAASAILCGMNKALSVIRDSAASTFSVCKMLFKIIIPVSIIVKIITETGRDITPRQHTLPSYVAFRSFPEAMVWSGLQD